MEKYTKKATARILKEVLKVNQRKTYYERPRKISQQKNKLYATKKPLLREAFNY